MPLCGKPFAHKITLEYHKATHYSEEDKKKAAAQGIVIPRWLR